MPHRFPDLRPIRSQVSEEGGTRKGPRRSGPFRIQATRESRVLEVIAIEAVTSNERALLLAIR